MASLEQPDISDGESHSDSDDDTEEEDPRIEKFKSYLAKHTVEQSVTLLNSKICSKGCKPLVIGGMMCFNTNNIMFYLLSEALFEVGPQKISQQFKNRGSAYYKALCGDDNDRQLAAICSLERFVVESEDLADLHPVLNILYSSDVVNQDENFEKWFETPNLSRDFGIEEESRELTRTTAEPFMNWLRTAGEDEDDEEIDVAY